MYLQDKNMKLHSIYSFGRSLGNNNLSKEKNLKRNNSKINIESRK